MLITKICENETLTKLITSRVYISLPDVLSLNMPMITKYFKTLKYHDNFVLLRAAHFGEY